MSSVLIMRSVPKHWQQKAASPLDQYYNGLFDSHQSAPR